MSTQSTKINPPATGEDPVAGRGLRNRSRIRLIAFWAITLVIVFELAAGAVWNLVPIDWIVAQLRHLGYPTYLASILGVWQAGAAIVIMLPRLPLIKEWAYVGSFFLWSGAVASHLSVGDPVDLWGVPLTFAVLAIASWALRPEDRRLPGTRLLRDRTSTARELRTAAGPRPVRPISWVVTAGILLAWTAGSLLTLPTVEATMRERAVEHGWLTE